MRRPFFPRLCRPRSFPKTDAACKRPQGLLALLHALCALPRSPPLALDALIAAGVVPPLVALLGRWEGFKAVSPVITVSQTHAPRGMQCVAYLARVAAALAAHSPAARRQLRDGGAVPFLRAIAAAFNTADFQSNEVVGRACREALRLLDPIPLDSV